VGAESAVLPDGFEYTEPLPRIDLGRLGGKGLVLQGTTGRTFTHLTSSGMSFGDLNGDGVDELAVESSEQGRWAVSLVRGGAGLPASIPALGPSERLTVITGSSHTVFEEGSAGCAVVFLGDVDGDGLGDLGIGAGKGLSYIVLGRKELPEALDVDDPGGPSGVLRLERLGFARRAGWMQFARLGDMTGDGLDDFAVGLLGAPIDPADFPGAGEVLFLAGRRDWPLWPEALDLALPDVLLGRIRGSISSQALSTFGLRALGDVNGDGLVDLLAGTRVAANRARAYVLYGRPEVPEKIEVDDYLLDGGGAAIDVATDFAWFNIGAPGDVNGDGFADILLGVEWGVERYFEGVTYLVYGGPDLPILTEVAETPAAPDGVVRIKGEWWNQQAGRVGPAGDFNDDGYADFLIGGPTFNIASREGGAVYLVFGGPLLADEIDLVKLGGLGIKLGGAVPGIATGIDVGPFGDLNGDGQTDFVFSELQSQLLGTPPGNVYVIYGPYGEKSFIRGDANFDKVLDISDAITVLTFLFLGGAFPLCQDALDADDTGVVDLTDAIYLLAHAFVAGPAPPAPYPESGLDPTKDTLKCNAF